MKATNTRAISILTSLLILGGGVQAQEANAPDPLVIDDTLPRESTEPGSSSLDTTIATSTPNNRAMTFSSTVTGVSAPTVTTLDADVAAGKLETLLGVAPSASSGRASGDDLSQRSFLRRGELLEVIPRVDRNPTQRRRKSEPVFPPRLQSGPRNRLRDFRR